MPPKRKSNPWYKVWKAIFKWWLYLLAFVLVASLINDIIHDFAVVAIIPFYLVLFTTPLFIVSFFALFIMRENDRERERQETGK